MLFRNRFPLSFPEKDSFPHGPFHAFSALLLLRSRIPLPRARLRVAPRVSFAPLPACIPCIPCSPCPHARPHFSEVVRLAYVRAPLPGFPAHRAFQHALHLPFLCCCACSPPSSAPEEFPRATRPALFGGKREQAPPKDSMHRRVRIPRFSFPSWPLCKHILPPSASLLAVCCSNSRVRFCTSSDSAQMMKAVSLPMLSASILASESSQSEPVDACKACESFIERLTPYGKKSLLFLPAPFSYPCAVLVLFVVQTRRDVARREPTNMQPAFRRVCTRAQWTEADTHRQRIPGECARRREHRVAEAALRRSPCCTATIAATSPRSAHQKATPV